jgi:phospholipid-binding lipoprotein MlaA
MMEKKSAFAIMVFILSVSCFNHTVFAQESKDFDSLLPESSISLSYPANSAYWLFGSDYNLVEAEIASSFDDEFENKFAEYSEQENTVSDPLYYLNYFMYSFNDLFYFALLKPVATGYKTIVPTEIRTGAANFFYNIAFPVRFVNNILQGKIKNAGTEVQIFLVNSTLGILGVVQVAQDNFGLKNSNEDLGQTLGKYSLADGFYLVWPIFGPSTLRDTVGLIGNAFLDPVNYIEPWKLAFSINSFEMISETSFRLGDYEAVKKASVNPYVAIRDAYIKSRDRKIKE